MSGASEDRYLKLSLEGVHAIEASAGTGKTFTLATLVLRLLVECRLRIGEVLAVTFTDAATQELRARIRARLLLALKLLDSDRAALDPPDAKVTAAVLKSWLRKSGESQAALRLRLREAADGIDLASIFTIHGFCARVLREHALESGQGFDAPELLANDRHLRREVAADLWRAHAVDPVDADGLLALWPEGPEALADDLPVLAADIELRPSRPSRPADPTQELRDAADALMAAVRDDGERFRKALLEAMTAKVLNGNSFKAGWVHALFDDLRAWTEAGDNAVRFPTDLLARLDRDFLLGKTNKGKEALCPDSSMCAAVRRYGEAQQAMAGFLELRCAQLLHTLRAEARHRLSRRKAQLRVLTYDDLIDRVADALTGPFAGSLAMRLRQQYRVALVDEFQDTDPRQWLIFNRVFGADSDAPALFLIGDPKQAIYGFRGGDVDTYLAAVRTADAAPPLDRNFRSRPSVLKAVETLYDAAGDDAFLVEGIRFHPVSPGGVRADEDFRLDRSKAPALTIWQAPQPEADGKGRIRSYTAETARALATRACVAQIHRLLSAARTGGATIDGEALRPGHIAVLVRAHHEATRIRDALAEAGIPAVAAGRRSLFDTAEALELHALLLALLHSADDGRLRAALATVLVGMDARAIAGLDRDGPALHDARLRALHWRERLQRGGVLALVNELCAANAGRLFGLLDGERRVSNYLQLAEQLQDVQARTLGLAGLVDWLARAIAEADSSDETQMLRLESDARRVQVLTLHKSKGLEYPLVFLPFANIGGKTRSPGRHVTVRESGRRVLHWRLPLANPGWTQAAVAWEEAQRAEDARLLYVGLTRASHALWLATGPFNGQAATPLGRMLADLGALARAGKKTIRLDDGTPPQSLAWLPPDGDGMLPPARRPRRSLASDWWIYSFTQLRHADAGHAATAAATETPAAAADEPALDVADIDAGTVGTIDALLGGSRFGNALHAALERVDFAAWSDWRPGDGAPPGQTPLLVEALRGEGYTREHLDAGVEVLVSLVGRTLTTPLPEGGALCGLPAPSRRAEIEFHFAMQRTPVPALVELLHRHGVVTARRGFGLRQRLEGLMTGKIDLTYVRDGRWYVLDYKSNRLPRYDAAGIAEAMAQGEYDLQALIYTLALHRWLRFRLGDAYDYGRDFGGVRYLFCRGLDGSGERGIHAHRFAPELVAGLDALFAARADAADGDGEAAEDES